MATLCLKDPVLVQKNQSLSFLFRTELICYITGPNHSRNIHTYLVPQEFETIRQTFYLYLQIVFIRSYEALFKGNTEVKTLLLLGQNFPRLTDFPWYACIQSQKLHLVTVKDRTLKKDCNLDSMTKTKELSEDTRKQVVDLNKTGLNQSTVSSSLMKKNQLLEQLLENERKDQINSNLLPPEAP